MKPPDDVKRELVQQWVSMAEEDLSAARTLLRAEPQHLRASVFHAQQASEKFLKALLVERQIEFPRTHDIDDLLDLVATADPSMAESLRLASGLTPYAVQTRYPGIAFVVTEENAREAVSLAEGVRDAVLPTL